MKNVGSDHGALAALRQRVVVLDGCLQAAVAALPVASSEVEPGDTYVPVAIESLSLLRTIPSNTELRCQVTAAAEPAGNTFTTNLALLDADGSTVMAARGVRMQRIARQRDLQARDALHSLEWRAVPAATSVQAQGEAWFVAGAGPGARLIAGELAQRGARVSSGDSAALTEALKSAACRGLVYVAEPSSVDDVTGTTITAMALQLTQTARGRRAAVAAQTVFRNGCGAGGRRPRTRIGRRRCPLVGFALRRRQRVSRPARHGD